MGLQFYLGRAGSGKTFRCLEEIAERLRRDPSPRGRPLIWLLPEQATAQAEAALLAAPGINGFARAHVLSFKRLAQVVLRETGGAPRDFLDEQGRHMMLRALVSRHREALRVFGRAGSEKGFITRLANTFSELAHYRHSFDDLQTRRKDLENQGRGESLLAGKLHDIELLGRAWEERLGERFANPDHFLNDTAQRIEQSALFDGAEVWLDSFSSFMPQELFVVGVILLRAKRVRATLLLDPDTVSSLDTVSPDPTRLFAQSEETYLRLRAMAHDLGVKEEEPITFPLENQATRFSDVPLLGEIEERLVRSGLVSAEAASRAEEAPAVGEGLPATFPPVLCVEAASRREEVEGVARAIRRLAREEGCRYRDIAVTMRDLAPYETLIRSAFSRHAIPFFMDLRRGVGHHPLVELLRSALRVLFAGWQGQDVVRFMRTDFVPITRHEVDHLENLSIEQGWQGERQWTETSEGSPKTAKGASETPPSDSLLSSSRRLDLVRLSAFKALKELRRGLAGGGEAGCLVPQAVDALFRFFEDLECGPTIERWTDDARERRELDQAEEHEQAWEGVVGLLSQMAECLEGESLSLPELSQVVETGLESLSLGLVPPSLDQVLVGTIERSRQPDLRAVFVIGLNDGLFPNRAGEDVILTDSDRETLRDKAGLDLGPTSSERLFRERYLGYVAFTRASRHLWVSWAVADEGGKALLPSPYVRAFLHAAQGPGDETQIVRLGGEWLDERIESVETVDQAIAGNVRASHGTPTRPHSTKGEPWERLLVALRDDAVLASRVASLAGTQWGGRQPDSVAGDESLPTPGGQTSVSRLETMAACPFQFFAKYKLGLEERKEFELGATDVGSFYHDVLADVFRSLAARYGVPSQDGPPSITGPLLDWGDVDIAEAETALEKALTERAEELFAGRSEDLPQADFIVDRARRHLRTLLGGFIEQGSFDAFLQAGAEVGFGFEGGAFAPLTLGDDESPSVQLRGKIDRLDVAPVEDGAWWVRIVDFKSSPRSLSLSHALAGLDMQLPLYLLALLKGVPECRPAGVFYVGLRSSITSLSAPPAEDLGEPSRSKARGALDSAAIPLFGPPDEKNALEWVAVRLKKDGTPGYASSGDWLPPGVLAAFAQRVGKVAGEWAEKIRTNCTTVEPYRSSGGKTPCRFCAYEDVCRMDPATTPYRRIPSMSKADVVASLEAGS